MLTCSVCGTAAEFDCDGEAYCPKCAQHDDEPWDGFNSDAEADADVLASAGYGTDEDYGGDYL
jgi:uncharacterized Zn finger protein (UPF0148 family)